jgi:hypothetical protein
MINGTETRINRALGAMEIYNEGNILEDTDIIDLLTDLMHLCKNRNINFDRILSLARHHYREER